MVGEFTMKQIIALLTLCIFGMPSAFATSNNNVEWAQSYALEANGEYEKAAAVIAPFLASGEDSEFALIRYASLNYLQGNQNDAIRAYKRALERNVRSLDARLGIAMPLMAQQRWKEASAYIEQVMAYSPFNYTAHIDLMACEEGLRNWEKLEKHASDMTAYYPSDATILVYLARAYAWQGKKDRAASVYQRVLLRYPEHLEASRYLNQ